MNAAVSANAGPVSRERLNAQGEPPPRHAVSRVGKGKVGTYIQIAPDGTVQAINGHVDLGTGVRTAFAQIVAEELDVPLSRVCMLMGDTDRTPDQGPTTASASIQSAAVPMRRAAAQVRQMLLRRAAEQWHCAAAVLTVEHGMVCGPQGQRAGYGELAQGLDFDVDIDPATALKPATEHRIVGRSVARLDIPAKVTGAGPVYVHDLRLPGMLHARMVRPPYRGRDVGGMIGRSLIDVDLPSVGHIPGLVKVVVAGDFVGVVAHREEHAIRAARQLKVAWRTPPPLPDLNEPQAAVRANPSVERVLREQGSAEALLDGTPHAHQATYVWPYQMHASIGPSCAVADYRDGAVTVWSGTQNPHFLHADIMALLGLDDAAVRIVRMEASGCYGRNCADDAAAEAALLSREVGAPVRLQLMREEEHAWEPKGTTQVMDVRGAVVGHDALAYAFTNRYPSNNAPVLALMQTGVVPPDPIVEHKGDRTAVPQYRCQAVRIAVQDMAPIVRAAWMRGVSALPNVFAHESFIDELAHRHGEDPLAFRLRFMEDPRARALSEAVATRAGWLAGAAPRGRADPAHPHVRLGRGFAQHQYVHGSFPGVGSAYCAWVCDVAVDLETGQVRVTKVWVGYDCGMVINPAGVRHQIHGNVVQSVSRALMEQVNFDATGVVSQEWGAYPILRFGDVPDIDVFVMPAQDQPPLGAGESGSIPSAAAIANAIFDATGARLRQVPFTPGRVRAALQAAGQGLG
ncbi:xanthine dehydrogenase family protein molybdopterin-binding subunit [Hydrogenophaga sp. BPS33]|uniref:xanthine dehydrogenase family protein molybdopterin-binding subunit n=1 Tax=Hydrogenophaga sp. BPS33 TaxID=2651974 RepID=UPI0013200691|nr:molybdopterin cofactor-binding domain-containing protein [Hydrogenophaga sp. BPS33]QHE84970.1 xanthine dehydrogenase family protein molybdopterin-binding subunit [Hydrogenophaga sp. BPS33]